MDQTVLLLEYLKEQYAQARQHETRQTNATTFLTAAAGVILGVAFRSGDVGPDAWWIGVMVILVGLTNLYINRQYFRGNRFHTSIAGRTRRALEDAIDEWTVPTPSQIRAGVITNLGLPPNESVGSKVYRGLRLVPFGVMALGVAVVIAAAFKNDELISRVIAMFPFGAGP